MDIKVSSTQSLTNKSLGLGVVRNSNHSVLHWGKEGRIGRKWDKFMAISSIRLSPIHIKCDESKSNMVPVSRQRVEWVGFYCMNLKACRQAKPVVLVRWCVFDSYQATYDMTFVWLLSGEICLTHRRCCNKTWGCPLSGPCSGPPGDQRC